MNRILSAFILITGCFTFASLSFAQKPWSLQKCINHAFEHNLQIKQSQLGTDRAELGYRTSQGAFLPTLNASASHGYNIGMTIDPFTNEFATDAIQSNNLGLSSHTSGEVDDDALGFGECVQPVKAAQPLEASSIGCAAVNLKNHIYSGALLSILALSSLTSAIAQHWEDEPDHYVSRRSGLEFGLNMGVYQANHESSVFYNGDGWYDLGDNSATLYSIEQRLNLGTTAATVQNLLNTESFEIPWDAYSYTMRYDPAMMFGFKTVYFWNPESALIFNLDVASIKASGPYTMHIAGLPGQGQGSDNIKMYGVFGEERRLLSSLGFRTSMYIMDQASWVFEFGATATGVQVVENYFNVENSTFDLIYMFVGPGVPSTGATSNLTNWGLGFYTVIGLEALFEEGGNLEANLRISRDKIHLGSSEESDIFYENNLWNAAIYVTWMIPPHIGDFVRASF